MTSTRMLCFLASCFLTPLLSILCAILYVYRHVVEAALKLQYGAKFVGLLEGGDVVWAVEEAEALSVINVVAILENVSRRDGPELLRKFRARLKDRLADAPFRKLLYQRRRKYGYHFWLLDEDVSLEESVRELPHESATCDGACNDVRSESFRTIARRVCNRPLPRDHTASWEILLGSRCSRASTRHLDDAGSLFGGRAIRSGSCLPVVFRIHHSLADGPALVKLLLELVDEDVPEGPEPDQNSREFRIDRKIPSDAVRNHVVINFDCCEKRLPNQSADHVLGPIMPCTYLLSLRFANQCLANYLNAKVKLLACLSIDDVQDWLKVDARKRYERLRIFVTEYLAERVKEIARAMKIFIAAPMFLIEQSLRSLDNSALHGPMLTGEKLVACWLESDSREATGQKLVVKIREIKSSTGTRFEDVLLAALSTSLHKYLTRINEMPPKSVTVVLPSKRKASLESCVLRNTFSVGLLPLCVAEANGKMLSYPIQNSEMLERLADVSRRHDALKNGPDYAINGWVIDQLCALLPERILRPILESHSTMIFSNLPGPQKVHLLGYSLKHVYFWIPNRSTTGIGFSVFSYGNDLELSLIADKALIKSSELLGEILENTVQEIENLYDALSQSCFSKSFIADKPVSMDIV